MKSRAILFLNFYCVASDAIQNGRWMGTRGQSEAGWVTRGQFYRLLGVINREAKIAEIGLGRFPLSNLAR